MASSYVGNAPINYVDPKGLNAAIIPIVRYAPIVIPALWPIIVPIVVPVAIVGGFIMATPTTIAKDEDISKDRCNDDPGCKGIARNVEKHVAGDGLPRHPKPCTDLLICLKRAAARGNIGNSGNQYALSVYNAICAQDWSKKYPNHTPHFPPFK